MRNVTVPFAAGLLFGVGLLISGMTRPDKVIAFLDVTGRWDPSLAFVMGGAVGVHLLAYRLVPRLPRPLLGGRFSLPTRRDVDAPLVIGAALFGAGWGIAGICPGPAVVSLPHGGRYVLTLVASMIGGMLLFRVYERVRALTAARRRSTA